MCKTSLRLLPASRLKAVTEWVGAELDDRCVPDELLDALDSTERAWMNRIQASTWNASVSTFRMLNPATRMRVLFFMHDFFASMCIPLEHWEEAVQIADTTWFRICPRADAQEIFALSAAVVLVVGFGSGALQRERHRALVDHVLDRASSYSTKHGGAAISMEDVAKKEMLLLGTLSSAPTSSRWISTFIARLDVVTRGTITDQLRGAAGLAHKISELFILMLPMSVRQPPRYTGLGCFGLALAVLGVLPDDSLTPSLTEVVAGFRRRIPKVGPRLQPQVLLDATEFASGYTNRAMQVCMQNVAACLSLKGRA
mmetsp:Transcript_114007/g.322448  ORF Transcript_114007/g.322448 Transcript_114007/m.322448 type:complete len:313 (+) Transcript_114007:86-1024(+)